MKRQRLLILMIALSLLTGMLNATVIRVNNVAGTGADYTTLQAAHDNATNGDTLMVEPGKPYGRLFLSKRLVILGPGYFLGQNPDTRASMFSVQVDSLIFNAGSEQTLVSGLHIKDRIFINTSLITLESNLIMFGAYQNWLILIGSDLSGIVLKKNYIEDISGNYEKCITVDHNSSVSLFNNFICVDYTSSHSYPVIASNETSSLILKNNVISGYMHLYTGCTVENNIWMMDGLGGTFPASGGSNNFTMNGTLTNSTDQTFSSLSDIFVAEGSTDGQWQLATGSAAIGAADDGGDCGMFGGVDPYVLSGINKSLPRIYYLSSSGQGTATTGLQVRVKAKAAE